MSTNYYIIDKNKDQLNPKDYDSPDWHIGKRSAGKRVKGETKNKKHFTWAMHPINLDERLVQEGFPDKKKDKGIRSSLGEEMTLGEFWRNVVGEADVIYSDKIGVTFC